MTESLSHLLSVILGGWVTVFVVKIFISRTIRDLDRVTQKLESLSNKFGVIETKVQSIDKMKTIIFEHDRRLTRLETIS